MSRIYSGFLTIKAYTNFILFSPKDKIFFSSERSLNRFNASAMKRNSMSQCILTFEVSFGISYKLEVFKTQWLSVDIMIAIGENHSSWCSESRITVQINRQWCTLTCKMRQIVHCSVVNNYGYHIIVTYTAPFVTKRNLEEKKSLILTFKQLPTCNQCEGTKTGKGWYIDSESMQASAEVHNWAQPIAEGTLTLCFMQYNAIAKCYFRVLGTYAIGHT